MTKINDAVTTLPHSTNHSEGDSSPSTSLGGGGIVGSSPVSHSTKNDATIPLNQSTIKIAEDESSKQQCNTLQKNFKLGANIETWMQHSKITIKWKI